MKTYVRSLIVVLIAGVVVAEPVQAAYSGSRGRRQRSRRQVRRPQPPLPPLPSVDSRAAESARRDAINAQSEASRTSSNLVRVQSGLRAKFESGKEMSAALARLREAQDAHANSSVTLLRKLRNDADYQQALEAKEAAKERVVRMQNNGGTPAEIAEAAKAATYGSSAVKMQVEAEKNDAAFNLTRARLDEAKAKIVALREDFERSARRDPKWITAQNAKDAADAKVSAAQSRQKAEQDRLALAQARWLAVSQQRARQGYGGSSGYRRNQHGPSGRRQRGNRYRRLPIYPHR